MLGVLNVSSLNLAPAAGSFPFPPKYITLPSGKKEILGIEQGGLQQKSSPVPSNLNGTFPVKRVEGSSEPVSPLSVSALHAEVWFQNGKIYIRDLDSPFGTFINDVKVQPGQEIALRRGDTLTLGIQISRNQNTPSYIKDDQLKPIVARVALSGAS